MISSHLTEGQSYVFMLTVTNFFGETSAMATKGLTKVAAPIPKVFIEGQAALSTLRNTKTSVKGVGSVAACMDPAKITYEWNITDATGGGSNQAYPELITDGREMYIAAYTAVALTTYTISLSATVLSNGTNLTSSASMSIYYGQSSLIALITGA